MRIVSPWRCAARSQHQIIAPYSWSVIRISPGAFSLNPDATRLIAADTFVVNTSRCGTVPRNAAVRSRASHNSGGACRTKKSVGPAARWRRNSVARSNTGSGNGPNEPVFSIVTVGIEDHPRRTVVPLLQSRDREYV